MTANKNKINQENIISYVPSWLETPSQSEIDPPVKTRKQELPLEKLAWEDFEKLCLRLVRLESEVEHCQLYGTRGQRQEGIDLYARPKLEEKYRVYQCKNEKDFGPSKIITAVDKFLKGKWVNKSNMLVLCTQESLAGTQRADELEKQSKVLAAKGVTLIHWDRGELSTKLRVS